MESVIESLYTILFIILAVAGVIIIVFACILFYLVFHDDQIANMDDIHSHLGTTQKRFDEKP
jgi:flagellar basal body-associated protein FliL